MIKREHVVEQYPLFSSDEVEIHQQPPAGKRKASHFKNGELAIALLQVSESQPRKHVDQEALAELASSIKIHGVLQPVIVQPHTDGTYHLVAGQRRFLAAKQIGLTKIPAVVVEGAPAILALIENLQRTDLTAVEEAEAICQLKMENGYTLGTIGGIIGKSKASVSETLSLTKLPSLIKEECRSDPAMAKSILVELARMQTKDEMLEAYQEYRSKSLPRQEIRRRKRPGAKERSMFGARFVNAISKAITTVDVDHIEAKERERMKLNLEKVQQMIEELIVRLGD
ncbi:ParB/RepB/Spo0J family partition protein [Citrifermentans bremense]|uniref:ParB/RepB/Spo0J family partition protein n=1 Tax=Citrifermentans bremense TaxID=60035 RepID=UPI00041D2751|nr:ParB/RepB/Spo0J family partition protein [Citrifermentans bremense]